MSDVCDRGRGRIGLLVPFTNTYFEPDMARLAPAGVSLHAARLGGYDADAIPDAAQMAGLGAADPDAPLQLIRGVKPDVILYGCTSATLAHGLAFDRALAARAEAVAGAPAITAAGALIAALAHLGARRVAFASPYVPALNDCAIAFLAESGVETVSRADVEGVLDNDGQGAMTPDEVIALAVRADSAAAEAVVLSCTDMRAVETVAPLEARLGKPVVTSNQALAFAACRALGRDPAEIACGALFTRRQAA
jgi:maleate cis-trans isomerase